MVRTFSDDGAVIPNEQSPRVVTTETKS